MVKATSNYKIGSSYFLLYTKTFPFTKQSVSTEYYSLVWYCFVQLNTLFSGIPQIIPFFRPHYQPKSLPFALPHPVLHWNNLNNIKSDSTHPLAYPLDIEFSVSTTGAYVFRSLLPQPCLISTTLRYGPRISRAALAKPDGCTAVFCFCWY